MEILILFHFRLRFFCDTRDLLYFVHPTCVHLTILHMRLWNNKNIRKTVLLCWVWLMVNFFLEKIFCGNLNEVILLVETALFRIPRKMFLKSKLTLRTDNEQVFFYITKFCYFSYCVLEIIFWKKVIFKKY